MQADEAADGWHSGQWRPTRRGLLQLGAFLGVTLGAPAAAARAAAATATPAGWPAERRAMVAEIAEMIIPATDTGGAKAAGVPAFIEKMVEKWFDADERANFLNGMAAFADGAAARHGGAFLRLTGAQKQAWYGEQLSAAEAMLSAEAAARPRSPFAVLMKRLTIFGYYTSELGATKELTLNLVPNEFVPNAHFGPHDRASSFVRFALPPFSAH